MSLNHGQLHRGIIYEYDKVDRTVQSKDPFYNAKKYSVTGIWTGSHANQDETQATPRKGDYG
jgi:hypothetical protein